LQGLYLHKRKTHTDIHASRKIRTHDRNIRTGEDSSCLRPSGYSGRHHEKTDSPPTSSSCVYDLPIPYFEAKFLLRRVTLRETFSASQCLYASSDSDEKRSHPLQKIQNSVARGSFPLTSASAARHQDSTIYTTFSMPPTYS
jgi:hypothetical protein